MPSPLAWSRRDSLLGLLLALLPALLALPIITKDLPLSQGDYISQYYIWQSYLVKQIREFQLLWWNPWVFGGTPFFANPQMAILSPFSWLLVPFSAAGGLPGFIFDLRTCLIIGIGSAGIFVWLRQWLVRTPALFAALLWLVSPVGLWQYRDSTTAMSVLAIWPWMLAAVERWISMKQAPTLFWLAILVALGWFAGHPPIFAASLAGLLVYVLIRTGRSWPLISQFFLALGLGLGISAIQLLPAIDFVFQTTQTSGPSENALPTTSFTGFLTSLFSAGAYSYVPITLGPVALVLLYVAWNRARGIAKRWWLFTGVVTLGMALILILLPALKSISLWHNLVRYPWRLIFLPMTGAVALAAYGLSQWPELIQKQPRRLQFIILGLGTIGIALVAWDAAPSSTIIIGLATILFLFLSARIRSRISPPLIAALGLVAVLGTWSRALVTGDRTWENIRRELAVLAEAPDTGDRITTNSHLLNNGSMLYERPNSGGYDSLILRSHRRLAGRWILTETGWQEQPEPWPENKISYSQTVPRWFWPGAAISLVSLGLSAWVFRRKDGTFYRN